MYSLMWKAAAMLGALSFHISVTASDLVLPGADAGQNSAEITQGRFNRELRHQLSKNASIHFTSSPQFGNLTDRWSDFSQGDIAVVVEPATTRDVAAAVEFANRSGLSFLAVGGGHGSTSALNTIRRGLSINLHKLKQIQISSNGDSVLLGGGVNTHEVINALAAHGKVTATTNGGCTSQLGPALGGGFGRYMGFFGLVLDNIIDMTVILANGTIAQVSSTSNPDLYWGMKGAGHNFGIVTEANFKIYDFPTPRWFSSEFTFAGPQLETLFERINDMDQPKELGEVYTIFAINPQYSTTEPVMLLHLDYAGTPDEARPWFDYFHDLHPVAMRKWESLSPTEIQPAASQDIDSDICAHGQTWRLFPLGLKKYNVTANRQVYDLFKQLVTEHPDFNRTVGQFENYAQQGVKAVDPASTAYANRDDDILVSFSPVYPPSAANDAIATEYGNKARGIWHVGDTPGRHVTAYLNYANGDESLEAVYGYESWRLERLRALKKRYDPENKFCFYNPIQ
ncbi:MAG: hypothetical protein L6R38_000611 [Xanthoria sp. 2 TBL-2021]|nr:MAG: hypothetical protein L6R38_000611 [Xanthoria sp. 2 TBL-2021]